MTVEKVLDTARAEIGTTEYPAESNRTKYGRAYGMDGVPWCMIFVWWCFNAAEAGELFYGGGKTASCNQYVSWAKGAGQWITEDFRAGDIIFLNFDKYPDADHVGIVESITQEYVITIEGNTSAAGSQDNGGAVMRKMRRYSDVYGAARPDYKKQEEKETMTQDEFNKMFAAAMEDYIQQQKTADIPNWAVKDGEFAKAVELGITDGTNPCAFIPRYQAAIMALRAREGK